MSAVLDIRGVLDFLPHRFPFVLVDRVLELEPGKRILAQKNVTFNEPFFPGHFPNYPVMPGVLIVEALAQAAAILAFQTQGAKADANSVYLFVGIDNVRFKKPVTPGDVLHLEVSIMRTSRGLWKFAGQAKVDGAIATEAEIMCTLRNI